MMGGAGAPKPRWMVHFESPILARLDYWRAAREYQAREEQRREEQREVAAKIEEGLRKRASSYERPRLVKEGDKDWTGW